MGGGGGVTLAFACNRGSDYFLGIWTGDFELQAIHLHFLSFHDKIRPLN